MFFHALFPAGSHIPRTLRLGPTWASPWPLIGPRPHAQIQRSEKTRVPSRMLPLSSPESPLSPRHFIAVFNSSRVAPSGADAQPGAAQPVGRGGLRLARAAGSGQLAPLGDALSAHWPGIRDLCPGCL